jgi:tetratricopeptide (TPR) repeat protein
VILVADLVGRARELRQVDAACRAASDGRGTVVVVSGEPGIGKTRFCDEVADHARALGLTVAAERCWVDGGAPALWPWQPIVEQVCGTDAAELLAADAAGTSIDPDRFARFTAVTDRLTAAAEQAPLCLIVDDAHAADAGSLLLLRFVARALSRARITIVVSRRAGRPASGGFEAGLLDDIEAEAVPIVLGRLEPDESAALLEAYGLDDLDDDLRHAVVRVAGGNPLYLRRLAALGPPGPGQGIPDGLQLAIERSAADLGPATQAVLRASAVLGMAPSVTEAAAVAGCPPAAALAAIEEAAAAGLVTTTEPDAFTFGHEVIRATLEAGLTPAERLDAHARAAPAVAGTGPAIPPDRLARRAHHARAAAARSPADALLAVEACQAAARSMVTSFAYEHADELVSAAVDLHDRAALGPAPGWLLVEWAQAARLCGRMADARARFERAARVTEQEADPLGFAEAALGLGGHWVHEHREPLERARVNGLQRAALDRLPDDAPGAPALRARLLARLAAEGVYAGEPLEPVFHALRNARACGDPGALAEALSLCHHALLAPEFAGLRLELADELVQVASEAGHGLLGLMGLCWRAVDLFLVGDPRAGRALENLRERADALACQNILYIVGVLDVMLLIREGKLTEAETAAHVCHELGTSVGEIDALGYLGAHILTIRTIQARDTELLDAAEAVATSTTLIPAEFGFRASAAAIAARAGHPDRARTVLAELAAGGLAALPRSSTWLVGIVAVAETALALGDLAVAREAYDLLTPYADRPIMPSLAVVCLGSTQRVLGQIAIALDDVDGAIDHLQRAVDANHRLGNHPFEAITQADLARALLRRDRPGDRDRALALLDVALAAADTMGLTLRTGAWRTWAATPPGRPTARLRREARGWLVALGEHRAFVTDRVGMRYLAELLRHPGRSIPALHLAAGDTAGAGAGIVAGAGAGAPLLDDAARTAYHQRIRELTEDLAEAELHADIARAERLRTELDVIVEQLAAATGLHGRPRRFNDPAERARTAVRKALKRAIDEIDAAAPAIGGLLRRTITTGAECAYTPGPTDPTWTVDG